MEFSMSLNSPFYGLFQQNKIYRAFQGTHEISCDRIVNTSISAFYLALSLSLGPSQELIEVYLGDIEHESCLRSKYGHVETEWLEETLCDALVSCLVDNHGLSHWSLQINSIKFDPKGDPRKSHVFRIVDECLGRYFANIDKSPWSETRLKS